MHASTNDAAATGIEIWPLLQAAWRLFSREPATFILGFLVVAAGGVLTLGVLLGPLLVGYIRMIDAAHRGAQVELVEVLEGLPSFGSAATTWLIITLAVLAATPLVVLPAVVIAFVWAFALWFVAIEEMRASEALAASWCLTREHTGSVLLLLLAVAALGILGSIAVVGWLLAGPLGLILMTLGFRQLQAGTDAARLATRTGEEAG